MLRSLVAAFASRRTLAVVFLSFSSGLPLGLIMYSIPVWMSQAGFDIRVVGLVTLTHAPWTFKLLWSPMMDRWAPPFLGRRRGWIVLAQLVLFGLTLLLAGNGADPDAPWVFLGLTLAVAFASASQDIVIDAYAVDVLEKDEQAVAVGARIALYRVAMFAAGAITITLSAWWSWPVTVALLACAYLPLLGLTLWAPPAPRVHGAPVRLIDAVWLPFVGFLRRHRALEILAFVLTYKAADNLADSLLRPFLDQMGYSAVDIGVALGTVGLIATLVGTFLGGVLTSNLGLGHCLWLFGALQVVSNLGYIFVAESEVHRPLMFGAMGFESFCKGLGMGAFGVLLLRMTQKRFSATQYALFSSLFALPRIVAGPIAGFTVHAVGWSWFFWFTIAAGIPGLLLLARFVPPGTRDPQFTVEPPRDRALLSRRGLLLRAAVGCVVGWAVALTTLALLAALEAAADGRGFHILDECVRLFQADGTRALLRLLGTAVFGCACGMLTAAVVAARHGNAGTDGIDDDDFQS